jgi:integrase
MRGSVKRRSPGSWCVRIELPRGTNGRRRQRRVTVHGTKANAEEVAAKLIAEISRGTYGEGSNPPISEFLDIWLRSVEPRIGEKTHQRYSSIVELHLKPTLGNTRIRNLRPLEVDNAISLWCCQQRKDGKAGRLSPTSVRRIFETLRTALNQAKKWNILAINPCDAASPPRKSESNIHVLDPAEAACIFRSVRDKDMLHAIMFDLATGLRRGELLALQWADVSWELKQIRVTKALEKMHGILRIKVPKTRASRRVVPLPKLAQQALIAQRDYQRVRLEELGIVPVPETPIFDRLGAYADPEAFSLAFYRLMKALPVPKVRFHDLRHSFGSLLLAAGVDLKVISELLGHSEIGVTANQYLHLLPSLRQEAAERFDTQISIEKSLSDGVIA